MVSYKTVCRICNRLNGFSLGSVVYEARSLSYITGTAPFTTTVSKHVFVNIDYPNPTVYNYNRHLQTDGLRYCDKQKSI